jgi:serine/threonine protein phosphatase PrpC
VRSALFRGREHLRHGVVDTVAEGPAAIAISIGGREKTYSHLDPNEDAALFAIGPQGILVAVADGHRGFEASEVALDHLASDLAAQWTQSGEVDSASWERHVLAVLWDANERILRELFNTEKQGSRTTLALALLIPERDLLLHASIGDSHIFQARAEGVEGLALFASEDDKTAFLGHASQTPEGLREKCAIGYRTLAGTRAVVLATDGLSERGVGVPDPEAAVAEVVEATRAAPAPLRAREAARGLAELALSAHRRNPSGDNIAAAVVWLEP